MYDGAFGGATVKKEFGRRRVKVVGEEARVKVPPPVAVSERQRGISLFDSGEKGGEGKGQSAPELKRGSPESET